MEPYLRPLDKAWLHSLLHPTEGCRASILLQELPLLAGLPLVPELQHLHPRRRPLRRSVQAQLRPQHQVDLDLAQEQLRSPRRQLRRSVLLLLRRSVLLLLPRWRRQLRPQQARLHLEELRSPRRRQLRRSVLLLRPRRGGLTLEVPLPLPPLAPALRRRLEPCRAQQLRPRLLSTQQHQQAASPRATRSSRSAQC